MSNLGVSEIIAVVGVLAAAITFAIRASSSIVANDAKHMASLKAAQDLWEAQLKAAIEKIETQRKADMELLNEKLGSMRLRMNQQEQAIWSRVRGVEKITGRAHVFTDDENGG
jgi:hypothetical protein